MSSSYLPVHRRANDLQQSLGFDENADAFDNNLLVGPPFFSGIVEGVRLPVTAARFNTDAYSEGIRVPA